MAAELQLTSETHGAREARGPLQDTPQEEPLQRTPSTRPLARNPLQGYHSREHPTRDALQRTSQRDHLQGTFSRGALQGTQIREPSPGGILQGIPSRRRIQEMPRRGCPPVEPPPWDPLQGTTFMGTPLVDRDQGTLSRGHASGTHLGDPLQGTLQRIPSRGTCPGVPVH